MYRGVWLFVWIFITHCWGNAELWVLNLVIHTLNTVLCGMGFEPAVCHFVLLGWRPGFQLVYSFVCSFRSLSEKSRNNLEGDLYHLLWFLHLRGSNQPTITVVVLCQKRLDAHALKGMQSRCTRTVFRYLRAAERGLTEDSRNFVANHYEWLKFEGLAEASMKKNVPRCSLTGTDRRFGRNCGIRFLRNATTFNQSHDITF
jgi:hypothetical protein